MGKKQIKKKAIQQEPHVAVKISNISYIFSPSLVTPGPQETQVWGRWGADAAQAKSEVTLDVQVQMLNGQLGWWSLGERTGLAAEAGKPSPQLVCEHGGNADRR